MTLDEGPIDEECSRQGAGQKNEFSEAAVVYREHDDAECE